MIISAKTSLEIAQAHQEVRCAEELLEKIESALNEKEVPDIRDAFGRRQGGLQLGVPSGEHARKLFNVPWTLAKPVIEAHIANQRSIIAALSTRAVLEVKDGSS